jgi:hypothetical protein
MTNGNTIKLTKDKVDAIDLGHLVEYISWSPEHAHYFTAPAGKEIYKLLAYISKKLAGGVVSDVGTFRGSSALALSYNENVQVDTFDTTNHIMKVDGTKTITYRTNISRKIVSGQAVISKIAESLVVVLDIDPHDGVEEAKFVTKLMQYGFKGLLVVDNIKIGIGMQAFWDNVPATLKKIDVTSLGHWVGTGIIVFDPKTLDVVVA